MNSPDKSKNFDDLQGVFSITYIESEKAPRGTFHVHDAYEMTLVVSDDVVIDVNNETYPVPCGSLLLFNTIDLHRIRYTGNKLYKRYVTWFKHDFLNEVEPLRHILLRCFYVRRFDRANLLILDSEQNKKLIEILDRLEKLGTDGDNTKTILKKLILAELLTVINELYFINHSVSELSFFKNSSFVYNAIQYIQENYWGKISQDQLAKLTCTNKRTLNESFSQVTGLTVGQYILNCRITSAKAFLVQGMSVSEVCEKTGFGNFSNFSRTFRNHVGLSPKQYAAYHKRQSEGQGTANENP